MGNSATGSARYDFLPRIRASYSSLLLSNSSPRVILVSSELFVLSPASFDPNMSTGDRKSEEKYREWYYNRKTIACPNSHQPLLSESRYAFVVIVNVRPNLLHRRTHVYQFADGCAECFRIELATALGGECKVVVYTHNR